MRRRVGGGRGDACATNRPDGKGDGAVPGQSYLARKGPRLPAKAFRHESNLCFKILVLE